MVFATEGFGACFDFNLNGVFSFFPAFPGAGFDNFEGFGSGLLPLLFFIPVLIGIKTEKITPKIKRGLLRKNLLPGSYLVRFSVIKKVKTIILHFQPYNNIFFLDRADALHCQNVVKRPIFLNF